MGLGWEEGMEVMVQEVKNSTTILGHRYDVAMLMFTYFYDTSNLIYTPKIVALKQLFCL